MNRVRPADMILYLLYVLAIILSLRFLPGESSYLEVHADGHDYAYSLNDDGIYGFSGPLGITEIEIRNGRARIISSPCPNGTCIKDGWSGMLCCLPNKVIAVAAGESDVDAVSR